MDDDKVRELAELLDGMIERDAQAQRARHDWRLREADRVLAILEEVVGRIAAAAEGAGVRLEVYPLEQDRRRQSCVRLWDVRTGLGRPG